MFTNNLAALLLLLLLHGHVDAGRIVGGHESKKNSRPYMVLLQRGGTEVCGGILLNEDFVLTAAHCRAKSYVALLGLHTMDQNKGVQKISVKQDFLYKDGLQYDVMLLKLSSKANRTDQVEPIDLAERDDGCLPGKCSVAGWGKTTWTINHLSNTLMEVDVTLVDCPQQGFYCSAGQSGPNQGDSGGPLVCEDGKAYGLVSHMIIQQNGEREFRFTKIPDYIDWIISTINDNK